MRLLMTTDTVGGVWTFTSELTKQLLQHGHAVHLVSFGRTPSPDQSALQEDLRGGFPETFAFTSSEIPLEWMQDNENAHTQGERLLQEILRNSPKHDLLVSNQFCFGRLSTSIPRIVVAHSDVLSWARACKPSALEPTPWLNQYTSIVQSGLLDAAAVVTPTSWMGQALMRNFFMPRNYVVIPNGVDAAASSDLQPARILQAITAGRLWDEAKGLDTLRDLQSPIPLLVAGDNTLDSLNTAQAFPEHLINLGPLSRADLHGRFRQSAIYLCTSRYEPFGLAPLEAALCGCALVCRDLPSLREIWADSALYFTDNASLANTLNVLASDPAVLAHAQARALQRAQQFTAARMAESYLRLFHAVLQQPQFLPYAS
jgi:glycogen synthase